MSKDNLEQDLSASDDENVVTDEFDSNFDENAIYDASEPFEADSIDDESDLQPTEASSVTDSYLDDDDEWAASADRILHQDESTVIVQQDEAVVNWDIQGLYDDNGKVRGKRSLKNNPPMLVISDSLGDKASFVLTKDLAGVLSRHFENAHRAYYGIKPKDELSFKEKMSEAKAGVRQNMGKVIIVGGLLAALLIFGLIF